MAKEKPEGHYRAIRAKPEEFTAERTGRRSRLDEKFIKDAAALRLQGLSENGICRTMGVLVETWTLWKRRGRNEMIRRERGETPDPKEEVYMLFYSQIERARGYCELQLLRDMKAAGANQWNMYAWLLERFCNSDWGRLYNPRAVADEDTDTERQENDVVILELPDNGRD